MSGCVAGAAPGCPIPYPYPPLTYPSIQGRDNGFNVFVGGNLVIMSGGAELEGRTYVNGNFDVQKSSGAFNVGYVGAGSYVIPDNGADALIIATEWNEFRKPNFVKVQQALKTPAIFDGRNLFEPSTMLRLGFVYHSIGRVTVGK